MKRKMVLGVLAFLLVLQAQMVFAADGAYEFFQEIQSGNLSKAERILKNNARRWSIDDQRRAWFNAVLNDSISSARSLQAAQLLYQYNVGWDDSDIYTALGYKKSEDLIRYLIRIRMPFGDAVWSSIRNGYGENFTRFLIDNGATIHRLTVYSAIDNGYSDNFVQFLLDKGAWISNQTLQQAAQNKRWTLVSLMVNRLGEDDMSYRYTRADATTYYNSQSADYRSKNPFNYDPIRSKTALMFASEFGHLNTVKLLVEKGAKVNLRADDDSTAASLAYDNGEIEIYNYLKANGAIDFEPRQVTQQPTTPTPAAPTQSTTNVYVQPSAPAQPAPAPAPATPTLQTGRYAYSGSNVTMTLNVGLVSLYIGNNVIGVGHGTYRINGNQLVITIMQATGDYSFMSGRTYAYTITGNSSFSGSGETWVRTGSY